jgi:hypothetical protein
MWEEVFVALFKVSSQQLLGVAEETIKILSR